MPLNPHVTPFDDEHPSLAREAKLQYRSKVIYILARRSLRKDGVKIRSFGEYQAQRPFLRHLAGEIKAALEGFDEQKQSEETHASKTVKSELKTLRDLASKLAEALDGAPPIVYSEVRNMLKRGEVHKSLLDDLEFNCGVLVEAFDLILEPKDVGGRPSSKAQKALVKHCAELFVLFTGEKPRKSFGRARGRVGKDGTAPIEFTAPEINFISVVAAAIDPEMKTNRVVSILKDTKLNNVSLDALTGRTDQVRTLSDETGIGDDVVYPTPDLVGQSEAIDTDT